MPTQYQNAMKDKFPISDNLLSISKLFVVILTVVGVIILFGGLQLISNSVKPDYVIIVFGIAFLILLLAFLIKLFGEFFKVLLEIEKNTRKE